MCCEGRAQTEKCALQSLWCWLLQEQSSIAKQDRIGLACNVLPRWTIDNQLCWLNRDALLNESIRMLLVSVGADQLKVDLSQRNCFEALAEH